MKRPSTLFSTLALAPSLAITIAGCQSSPPPAAREEAIRAAAERLGRDAGGPERPTSATSRAWQPGQPLTIDAAVSDALSSDPSVQAVLARLDAERARVDAAGRLPNPMLDMALGAPIGGMGVEPYALMVAQQLNFLWTLERREQVATAGLRAATLDAARTLVDAALDTRAAFLRAWIEQERARLSALTVDAMRRSEGSARDEARVGIRRGADVAAAASQLARAEGALATVQARAEQAAFALLRKIGAADAAIPALQSPGAGAFEVEPNDQAALLAVASSTDLTILAAVARVEAAAARLGLSEAQQVPDVTASVARERDMEGDSAWMFGLSIEIPIFDDGSPAVAEARAELTAARLEAEAARQTSTTALRSALVQLRAAEASRNAAAAAVHAAERTVRAADLDAQSGLVPSSATAVAAAALANDADVLAEARLRVALAAIDLERARLGSRPGVGTSAMGASSMAAASPAGAMGTAAAEPQESPMNSPTPAVMKEAMP